MDGDGPSEAIQVEASIVINRAVEDVFAFFTDHRNDIRWQEGLLVVRVTPEGSSGMGTRITAVRKLLSRRVESTVEICETVPNQKEGFKTLAGPIEVTGWLRCEPEGRGTLVSQRLEVQTHGFFSIADFLVASTLQRTLATSLRDVKDLLEAGLSCGRPGRRQRRARAAATLDDVTSGG